MCSGKRIVGGSELPKAGEVAAGEVAAGEVGDGSSELDGDGEASFFTYLPWHFFESLSYTRDSFFP